MPAPYSFKPEGRIGDATFSPATDPRFHPKLVEALATQGWDKNLPIGIADENSSFEQLTKEMRAQHYGFSEGFAAIPNDLAQDVNEPPVDRATYVAKGVDGNDVKLYMFRKSGTEGQVLPCVVYLHGGGMTTLDTLRPGNVRWLTDLAQRGVVSVAIDFRNAWSETQYNPFPAGLNDCAEGLKYIASHRGELGIGKIILEGESGGANLCLATALKANQEGWIRDIDGVYAYSPNVCNVYGWSAERIARSFPSRLANDGYMFDTAGAGAMQSYYAPNIQDRTHPIAFPYYATVEMCRGLPPHIIRVDELDPLRDEGIAYYRKLCAAGVDAVGRETSFTGSCCIRNHQSILTRIIDSAYRYPALLRAHGQHRRSRDRSATAIPGQQMEVPHEQRKQYPHVQIRQSLAEACTETQTEGQLRPGSGIEPVVLDPTFGSEESHVVTRL